MKEYYRKLCEMKYWDAIKSLKQKYGEVPGDYFVNEKCCSKNSKITGTSRGLFVHHDMEIQAPELSSKEPALRAPFEYQKAHNLTYANIFEHLILHCLIFKETNGELSFPGIMMVMLQANGLFESRGGKIPWKQNCYNAVKDDFDDYIEFLTETVSQVSPVKVSIMDVRDTNIISQRVEKAVNEYRRSHNGNS